MLSVACEAEVTQPDVLMTGLSLTFGNRGIVGFPYLSTSSVMEEHHTQDLFDTADIVLADLAPLLQTDA